MRFVVDGVTVPHHRRARCAESFATRSEISCAAGLISRPGGVGCLRLRCIGDGEDAGNSPSSSSFLSSLSSVSKSTSSSSLSLSASGSKSSDTSLSLDVPTLRDLTLSILYYYKAFISLRLRVGVRRKLFLRESESSILAIGPSNTIRI